MKRLTPILFVFATAAIGPALGHAEPEPGEPAKSFSYWSEVRVAQATIPEQTAHAESAGPIIVKVNVASTSPKPDGLPIYRAIPGAPIPLSDVAPTAWGRYRPSNRPSQQIEHVHHVVSAGYLR
jgi:hypothetical protein